MQIKKEKNVILDDLKVCKTFLQQNRGLMFSRKLKRNAGLLFIFKKEAILPIHMLFVFFPIDIVWLDTKKKIVDIRTAKPFELLVSPKTKAKYFIEMRAGLAKEKGLKIGNILSWN